MLGSELGISRPEAKQGVFETLFSSGIKETTFSKAFSAKYPMVHSFIKDFKSVHHYKTFSQELQRVESSIMIGTIHKRLIAEGAKVLTKHDSYLFTQKEADFSKPIIIEELDRIFALLSSTKPPH